MKHFILKNFNDEEFGGFIKFMNAVHREDGIKIYLNSGGGQTNVKDAIVNLINENPERFHISAMHAASAAFVLLLEVKAKVTLMKHGMYMCHKGSMSINVRDGGEIHGELSKFQNEILKTFKEDLSYLTKDERKKFDDGRNVYMGVERMSKVLKSCGKIYYKDKDIWLFE